MSTSGGKIYLVTGGCGFLGKRLVQMLLEREKDLAEVRVFDLHLDESVQQLDRDKVVLIKGNISNLQEVEAAVKGAHVVIHAASLVDVWGRFPPSKIREVNVIGTSSSLDSCYSELQCTWVYNSTMEARGPNVKGRPFYRKNEDTNYDVINKEPYPASKAMAEKLIIEANGRPIQGGRKLATCALRPTGIYGEEHPLMKQFFEKGLATKRCMIRTIPASIEHGRVYVGNVAWMHLLAAQKMQENPLAVGGQIYFCYDDSPYKSYEDFNMELLGPCNFRLLGSRPLIPFWLLYCLAWVNSLLQWLLKPIHTYTPLLNPYTLRVVSTTFTVQTDKAQRQFGYRPLYSWEDSRDHTVKWLKELDSQKQAGK
ncbi:3 beta-hydroxysteroid dehydrogenase type 7 [Sphaerodactylus townsendi]|uniref:3 beta-hydroxysteroid dehydrogenase type 7 n=1 Tax=Sphaerodactylus townsendi TaxID=933632 RepID=UPI0020267CFC|nr:3 beta-hydroxysteroid dehydrogenase type 7 [Sphaerodactylus townsendi]